MPSMRIAIVLLSMLCLADQADGQLISPNRKATLNGIAVEVAAEVPESVQGNMTLTFDDIDIYFDGGSYGAPLSAQRRC